VLFTNAKCGGTTLKAWFFDNLDFATLHRRPVALISAFGPRYAAAHLRRGWRLARRTAQARHDVFNTSDYKHDLRAFINFYRASYCAPALTSAASGFRRICVVRHPARRLVSAYLDKFCTAEDRSEPFVREVMQALGRDDPSFRDLLDYLERVEELHCNPHWRRQTYVLDRQRIDNFVRLEALHEEMLALADVVGTTHLPMLQGRLQVTQGAGGERVADPAEDLTGLPSAEIAARRKATGRFPAAACFLTPEATERIRRIYAADFERLPYP
jgi:hypothetical protein